MENEETREEFDLTEGTTRTFLEHNFYEESRREFDSDNHHSSEFRINASCTNHEDQEVDEELTRLNKGETLKITLNNANVYEISRLENTENDCCFSPSKLNEEEDIDKLEDVSFRCAIPSQQQRDYSDNIEDYQDTIDDLDELAPLPSQISVKKLRFFNRSESNAETDETQRLLDNSTHEKDKPFNRHDLVEQFCTKHLEKIKLFANKLAKHLPKPSLEAMFETRSLPIRSDSLGRDRKSEKKGTF